MGTNLALFLLFGLAQHASCTSRYSITSNVVDSSGKPGGRSLVQVDTFTAASTSGSPVIPGQYIVFFHHQAGPVDTAAQMLVAEVISKMAKQAVSQASTAAARDTTDVVQDSSFKDTVAVLNVIGGSASDTRTTATSSSSTAGIQAAVLRAPRKALRHIRRSRLVQSVIQDREVVSQQTVEAVIEDSKAVLDADPNQSICVEAHSLNQGIAAAPSSSFRWPGCRIAGSRLVWKGQACSDGSSIQYSELRAVRQNGALIGNCILRPDPARRAWTLQRFGSCGVRPTFSISLPTSVCSATGGNPGSSSSPPPLNGPSRPPVVQPPNSALPKVPIAGGEVVTTNMQRIEAATAAGVGSAAGLPAGQQVTVAVIDSGIDGTHPDLNLKGGKSWATPSANVAGDVTNHDVDLYGHGTHVAGIIGAKNSGQGVFGVVPNTPLYSLKVLNGEGKGTLSSVLQAISFAYSPQGKAASIGVINLSLASKLDPASPTYQLDFSAVCSVFKDASDNGIVVTAAAGNYGASMRGYVPASCPTVLAVTSIDLQGNAPSSFSNYLPADATAAETSMIIAAPGSDIYSTISYAKDSTGYKSLLGTSMASPHVAGVAAACTMSGACSSGSTGVSKVSIIQAAAQERLSVAASYGFNNPSNGNTYGHLVWSKW